MKFKNEGNYSSNESNTPAFLESVGHPDKTQLTAIQSFIAWVNDNDPDNMILETKWEYVILYKRSTLFEFISNFNYELSEIEIKPTDVQLDDIITKTYQRLIYAFNQRRLEFPIFDEVPPFDQSKIEPLRQQLYVALSPLIEP